MTATSDERLKSYLNANQLSRERMCGAILAIDRRFSGVKPRHPGGGPDGGIDLEATFQGSLAATVAVGFLNDVHDSPQQAKKIKKKFKDDLSSSAARDPRPDVFVFFTNINLKVSERAALTRLCHEAAIPSCEIYDRERMRIALDSPDGLAIRFQFLGIPMSEAEQAAFFSRWGDDIQTVIASGFGNVERALKRIQFLYEAEAPLEQCTIMIELDRPYPAEQIGHFRLTSHLHLKEPQHGIFAIVSGATDDPNRNDANSVADLWPNKSGILHGMCGRQWASGTRTAENESVPIESQTASDEAEDESDGLNYWQIGSFTSIGAKEVTFLSVGFGFGGGLFRFSPYLRLKDLDDSTFALFANKSLAEKIKTIHVTANEYKLAEFSGRQIRIDSPNQIPYFPMPFSEAELKDEWVRIMKGIGAFNLSFSSATPMRLFEPELVSDSLYPLRQERMRKAKKYWDEQGF